MIKKFLGWFVRYWTYVPPSKVTIREPDISKCRVADITAEQYSAIMDRWDNLDMMDIDVPVFWKEGENEEPIFFWNNDFIDFTKDVRIHKELYLLGIEYKE